ncbi:hypothetical protein ACSVBT_17075 [Afipia sp. TerB]
MPSYASFGGLLASLSLRELIHLSLKSGSSFRRPLADRIPDCRDICSAELLDKWFFAPTRADLWRVFANRSERAFRRAASALKHIPCLRPQRAD